MTTIKDPPRLFESLDAPAELRGWLERAHEDALPEKVVSALLERLDAQLAAPQTTTIPEQALRTFTKARIAKRLAPVLVVLGLGAAGTATVLQRRSPHSAMLEAIPLEHWDASLPNTGLGPYLDSLPPQPITLLSNAQNAAALTSSARVPRGRTLGAEHDTSPRSSDVASSDEYRLLRAARDAVERDPARALNLVAQHARSFPKGMLGQEREAIAINALMRLGRTAEARERGSRFVRAYPGSPHAKRIEAAIKK